MKAIGVLLMCLCCSHALAWTLTGRVLYVDSGDALTVRDANGFQSRVRLRGIDAPAMSEQYGRASKDALSETVTGRFVVVDYDDRDSARGVVGTVRLSGQDMNLRQLYAGLARYDPGVAAGLTVAERNLYAEAESEAKENHRGLWTDTGAASAGKQGWRGSGYYPYTPRPWSGGWGTTRQNPTYRTYPAPDQVPGSVSQPETSYAPPTSPPTRRPWGW
ncbi:MAG: thermonuclease family protein [Gammaproteobacteria bacterium]|nr:thermonuclease family protein [Gammaproteobacteria bacterium]